MLEERSDFQEQCLGFFAIASRRKYWILIPFIIGIVASIYLVKTLPEVYESSTLILVESQKIPQSVVQSALPGSAKDRLMTIKQEILSRSFLHKIVDKFELYEKDEEPSPFQQRIDQVSAYLGFREINGEEKEGIGGKIKELRDNVVVKTIGKKRLESFSISFRGRDPVTVMNVANELASLTIREHLRIREASVEEATEFLDDELMKLKSKLELQESLIGTYKRAHMGELPEQLDSNLRALDRYQLNLGTIRQSKKAAEDRILDLERMLETMKLQIEVEAGRTAAAKKRSVVIVPPRPLTPLEIRLKKRTESLSSMLLEYKESYPDVVSLRREVRDLESQVAFERINQELMEVDESPVSSGFEEEFVAVDLTPIRGLHSDIKKVKNDWIGLQEREREIEESIQMYERRVELTPKREQEIIILTRDYEKILGNYGILLDKKLNAQITESLEKRQKGEQFRIIDPANLPEAPVQPDKMMIGLMGIALGLGVGIGLAYFREQLDNSIRKPEDVEKITSVLVLASIPDFSEETPKRKRGDDNVVDMGQFSDRKKMRSRGGE